MTFDSGLISIGDVDTVCAMSNSISMGAGAIDDTGAVSAVVLGPRSYAIEAAQESVVVGLESFASQGSAFSVVLGHASSSTGGSPYSVTIGREASGNQRSVVIGTEADAHLGAFSHIVIGHSASIGGGGSSSNIAIGFTSFAGGSRNVMVGTRTTTGPNSPSDVIAIGPDAIAGTTVLGGLGIQNAIAIGSSAWASDIDAVSIGGLSRSNTSYSVAIGYQAVAEDGLSVCIGREANISTGIHDAECVAIGYQTKCNNSLEDNLAIGRGAEISGGSFATLAIGGLARTTGTNDYSVIIGYSSRPITYTTDPSSVILIGRDVQGRSSGVTAIGTGPAFSPTGVGGGSDLGVAIGYELAVGLAPGTFVLGSSSYAIRCNYGFLAGHLSTMGWVTDPLLQYPLAIGYQNVIADPLSAGADIGDSHIAVGVDESLLTGSDGTSIFGRNSTMYGEDSVIIGNDHWIANNRFFVFGIGCLSDGGPLPNNVTLGHYIYAVSVDSFTMGVGATAQLQSFVVGSSTYLPAGASAIHKFTIKGYNGGAVDTLVASDAPAVAGQVGLNIVLNTGAGVVNKDIHGAAVPPPGSLLLHVAP